MRTKKPKTDISAVAVTVAGKLIYPDNNEFFILLGANIASARCKKNLSRYELATLVQCSDNSIYKIEKGDVRVSLEIYINIVSALELSIDELLPISQIKQFNNR